MIPSLKDDNMDILEKVAHLAAERGLSLGEVSQRIGKPKQYLSNALKHRNPDGSRRDPRFSTVVALCEVLGTTPDGLLSQPAPKRCRGSPRRLRSPRI